mmetsp:Transcript_11213/g.28233  ORF Transcript_11213/g.28233 Transcript_11213/m.28233 type:complete len:329 (+) Transcript_11213:2514-3500(+)
MTTSWQSLMRSSPPGHRSSPRTTVPFTMPCMSTIPARLVTVPGPSPPPLTRRAASDAPASASASAVFACSHCCTSCSGAVSAVLMSPSSWLTLREAFAGSVGRSSIPRRSTSLAVIAPAGSSFPGGSVSSTSSSRWPRLRRMKAGKAARCCRWCCSCSWNHLRFCWCFTFLPRAGEVLGLWRLVGDSGASWHSRSFAAGQTSVTVASVPWRLWSWMKRKSARAWMETAVGPSPPASCTTADSGTTPSSVLMMIFVVASHRPMTEATSATLTKREPAVAAAEGSPIGFATACSLRTSSSTAAGPSSRGKKLCTGSSPYSHTSRRATTAP